jgi:branched-chain amino acid transport system ATP-binding protein
MSNAVAKKQGTKSAAEHRAELNKVPHKPGSHKPEAILTVDNVSRSFGGLTAVDVDHLEVQRGRRARVRVRGGAGQREGSGAERGERAEGEGAKAEGLGVRALAGDNGACARGRCVVRA